MTLTPAQAAEALRDVERARNRSVELYSYRVSSPQLILWGVFWIIGYGATDLAPQLGGYIWGGITLTWVILGSVLNHRIPQKTGTGRNTGMWRFIAVYAIVTIFIFCTIAVMQPRGAEMGAFVPLLISAMYTILGMWIGWRYSVIGIGLAILTMAGFFFLPAHFLLWMGFVGGGTLILTGLWLRGT